MKLKLLNQKGFSHWLAPIVVVALIIGVGGYIQVRQSHADSMTAQSICGKGFEYVGLSQAYSLGGNTGRYYILKNSATQRACAVNMSTKNSYGVRKRMAISINVVKIGSDGSITKTVATGGEDTGSYLYYAGPVYVNIAGYNSANYHFYGIYSTAPGYVYNIGGV